MTEPSSYAPPAIRPPAASVLLLMLVGSALAISGCKQQASGQGPPPLQKVKFVTPTTQLVRETEDFPGRTAAVEIIDLRSRVTGYLDEINFEDGAHVEKGDLLFVIDPRTYVAEELRTKALIEQFRARVSRLERQEKRSLELFEKQAISQDEYETIKYDRNEAQASLDAAIAAHDLAKLNVEFTRIKAPIAGRLSRRLVDVGNLVMANETPLATLIPLDQVYVYFDMDERTVLRLRRLMQELESESTRPAEVKVAIALADSDQFTLEGIVDFEDNQIDPSTGTLRVRATVDNPKRLLSPGLFVRVRYPIGDAKQELTVPEESLGSDQGRPFVYVIGEGNKVAYRPVELGPQVGGQRVIREGIELGERIVVTGLQRVRREAEVIPEPAADTADDETSAIAKTATAGSSTSGKSSKPSTSAQGD